MNFLKTWAEYEHQIAKFREIEKQLDLPLKSINSDHQRELVLRGIPYEEAQNIDYALLKMAQSTIFTYDTVLSCYRRIKNLEDLQKLLDYCSGRGINPHIVIDLVEEGRE